MRLEPTYGVEAIRYSLLVVALVPIVAALASVMAMWSVRADLARSRASRES